MMKKKTIFLTLVLAFSCVVCSAVEFRRATTFEDAYKASCRVSVSNARGTGTFIGYDREKNRCLILTNYHVVTNHNSATLDFWTNGVRQSIGGKIIARFYDPNPPYDFALIEVDPNELAKINPPYVALAGKGAAPDNNSYILSSGCPKGRFAQAWKGKVLGYYNGTTVMFQPGPVPGQSGSGVISEIDGQLWLTAVLTWLLGTEGSDDSRGGAIPVAKLYEALQGQKNISNPFNDSPIPPDAVECAIKDPIVIEFTQNDCPPCVEAGKDVNAIRNEGFEVRALNVSESDEAKRLAVKHKINGTPTFIVVTQDEKEYSRYTGVGKAAEILADLAKLTEKDEVPVEAFPEKPTTEDEPYADKIYQCFLDSGTFVEPDESFRTRAPVYEYELEQGDANFFTDADGTWRSRNRKVEPPAQKTEPEVAPPTIDESKLGDRLKGKLDESINKSIDLAIDKASRKADELINSKVETIKKELQKQINYWKWRVIFWSILIVFVIVFFTTMFFSATLAMMFDKDAENESKSDLECVEDEENNEGYDEDISVAPVATAKPAGTARRTYKKTTKRAKR